MEVIPYEQLRPSTDEKPIRDLQFMLTGGVATLVAYELGLFTVLEAQSKTAAATAEALGVSTRAAQALLSICASVGFIEWTGEGYALTAFGREYLVPSSPTYYGAQLDNLLRGVKAGTYANYDKVKQAVLTDEPQGAWGRNIFDYSTQAASERGEAQRVVDTFHARSLTPSTAWPHHIDLSKHQTLLDVGGASGAHAMGAAAVWPHLTALVLDFEPVCRAAGPGIARHGLAGRVRTHAADMFHDPYPPADVHFYSNVLHDWPPERGKFLLDKSFAALPTGGLVILHEMLFNEDKTGPPGVASLNLDMLNGMLGQQFTGRELTRMLEDAGFVKLTTTATFAYYSIVVGEKPH